MVIIERKLTYSCDPEHKSVCLELLEKIDEELSLEAELVAELRGDKLMLRVVGLEHAVESSISKIRNYVQELLRIRALDPRRGVTAEAITKYVGKAIPLDVLAEVIKYGAGATPRLQGSVIYVDADLETVIRYAKLVAKSMDMVPQTRYSHALKKLLMAALALFETSINEVVAILEGEGLLRDTELTIPWQDALRTVYEHFLTKS